MTPSARLSGHRREEAIGRKPGELVKAGLQSSVFYAALWETILSGKNWRGELVNRRRDGSIYHEEMLIAPVKDEKGRITQFIAIKQDITARKRLEEELRHQASYDTLTGLSNRRHFLEQLEREQARLQRNGGEAAVLMLDLDRFKQINDTYGHAAGDEVLRAFALIVRDSLRRTDLAGRLGGEEFAILLPDTGLEQAHAFAERIRARVAGAAIDTGNATLQVTVSIGISALEATETRIETALARADAALYHAKRAGRNCIVLSDPHPLIGERSNESAD
jgi:diguanylate cyclase (GGDEF) domain